MSEQLDLFGIPPPRNDRLFLGALPGSSDSARISQFAHEWRREFGLTGKPLAPARLHLAITQECPGDLSMRRARLAMR